MHNLLKFISRYSNFLVFILLEVVAFLLIVHNNLYPQSSVLSTANRVVAWNYKVVSDITGYFGLRTQNAELAEENVMLRNRLNELENLQENVQTDSVYRFAQYDVRYLSAKVVQMTTTQQHNYMTINRGERDGVRIGMGVRNQDGVVGIVRTVGGKYSVIQPIINTHTNLSCRFAKNDYVGTLVWDGREPRFAQLSDVATHIQVNRGDTIVTSGLSPIFPADIPVGTVEDAELGEGDSYYTIHVRLATNFRRLKYVEVIENDDLDEIETLTNGLD